MDNEIPRGRIGAKFLSVVFVSILITYLVATLPFEKPCNWQVVAPGMSRTHSNEILQVYPWQANNTAYLVYEKRGLRTWYIEVSFEEDEVSAVRIFHEDLHDEIVEEIFYVWAYL
jgi:hypothetical protein